MHRYHVIYAEMAEEEMLELLFEVQGSCKPLFLMPGSLVHEIEREIELLGKNGILAYFSSPRGQQLLHKNIYILQRWNERWGKFVDVSDVDQVVDGDRLTITPQPGPEPTLHTSIGPVAGEQCTTTVGSFSKPKSYTQVS